MINEQYYWYGIQPSAIRELFAYGQRRKTEIGADNVYDFSLGNPCVPPPAKVKECLEQLINMDPAELHSYSMANGLLCVRQKIADYISQENNFRASADNIFITGGAAGGLKATINGIVNSGEEVILIAPYFPEYCMWVKDAGANVVSVKARHDNFQLDIDAINKAVTDKTAAIIINSPNNPTGVIYSEQNLTALADVLNLAQKKYNKDIYIISDEPYKSISFCDEVSFLPAIYSNTIICDSASKRLSMPGERIGHIYVSDTMNSAKKVYTAIAGAARVLGHVCAPVLFQRLYGDCYNLKTNIEPYLKNRDLLTKKLDELGFEYVSPQGAFYLWMKSPLPQATEFSKLAKKFELLLVPSDTFGIDGWIRIGYCVSKDTIMNSFGAWDKLKQELDKGKKW